MTTEVFLKFDYWHLSSLDFTVQFEYDIYHIFMSFFANHIVGLSFHTKDLCLMMELNLKNMHVLTGCPLLSQRHRIVKKQCQVWPPMCTNSSSFLLDLSGSRLKIRISWKWPVKTVDFHMKITGFPENRLFSFQNERPLARNCYPYVLKLQLVVTQWSDLAI